jgi:UPF0271 protein
VTIDLNCDMGELPDTAQEAALMPYISSASVACGGHAGDSSSMERTVRLALEYGVSVGAHPGYPDRLNFGREPTTADGHDIEEFVFGQLSALGEIANRLGASIAHVKPHGALYNLAATEADVAAAVARGVSLWNPDIVLFGLAGSRMLQVWRDLGFGVAAEAFADRAYEPDGSLRPRSKPGALITDPKAAADQALRIALAGDAQTICVHSDTPGAVQIAQHVRLRLENAGLRIASVIVP